MHPWCKATEIRYCPINQFYFTFYSCAIDIQLTQTGPHLTCSFTSWKIFPPQTVFLIFAVEFTFYTGKIKNQTCTDIPQNQLHPIICLLKMWNYASLDKTASVVVFWSLQKCRTRWVPGQGFNPFKWEPILWENFQSIFIPEVIIYHLRVFVNSIMHLAAAWVPK